MKTKIILLLVGISTLVACQKDITVPSPDYSSRKTIQCALEVGVKPKLYFYNTVPYFDNVRLNDVFVREANIKISDGTIVDSLRVDSAYDYLKCEYEYFYIGILPIQANQNYKLKILSGSEVFEASTQTNLSKVVIDSVGYTPNFSDIYGEHEGVIPYFNDIAGVDNYYRYEMTRQVDTTMTYKEAKIYSPCIGQSSVTIVEYGRSVYDDQNINGNQIRLVIEPAFSHRKGFTGNVRIESIDKVTFDFFDQLDKQKLGQLNPFVEPVFLTNGQFGSKAIGYFGSVRRSDPILFVFPE